MSRAERRAYKRLTKNQDPYALPANSAAARARSQKARTRRSAPRPAGDQVAFTGGRFLLWAVGGTFIVGLVAFSFAWPQGMPLALYIGLAAAVVWAALVTGFRYLQRRIAASR